MVVLKRQNAFTSEDHAAYKAEKGANQQARYFLDDWVKDNDDRNVCSYIPTKDNPQEEMLCSQIPTKDNPEEEMMCSQIPTKDNPEEEMVCSQIPTKDNPEEEIMCSQIPTEDNSDVELVRVSIVRRNRLSLKKNK